VRPPLGFVLNPLVRHSAERAPEALALALADPAHLIVLVAGDDPVLRTGEPATGLLAPPDAARVALAQERVLLGTLGASPVVAVLAPAAAGELFGADPAFIVADLRTIAVRGLVAPQELGILAMAKSLLDWHRRHRFCANCGAATEPAQAGFRRDCAACGTQHFPRTDPVVIMLVTDGDHCLLGRQSRFPTGMFSCLAGFLEPGETIEDAVRRETYEETGVRVGRVTYARSQPWPFPSSLMIGCIGEALSRDIVIDAEELEDARWFHRDEIRLMLDRTHPGQLLAANPIAIAHHLVLDWMEAGPQSAGIGANR
jgi:NAD+ diphosphatase